MEHASQVLPVICNSLSILVVDDAPSILKMVVRNAGATVESAKDGREGVEVFKAAWSRQFNIVITDIQVLVRASRISIPWSPFLVCSLVYTCL